MRFGVSPLTVVALAAASLAISAPAGEKKAPQGMVEDDLISVSATLVSPEQLKDMFGTGFDNSYTVVNVSVTPKDGKPYDVRFDDFILRSESNGEHGGPLSAGEIAGSGVLVVERTYGNRANVDSQRPIAGTKVQNKNEEKASPALDALKQKMLAEKSISEPEAGLLFFALPREKAKHLVLSCHTPQSKLRLNFK